MAGSTMQLSLVYIGVVAILIFIMPLIIATQATDTSKAIEGFATDPNAYKQDATYKAQVKALSDRYSPSASAKRPVSDLLPKTISTGFMKDYEQNFVNFYSLGCRYTGYIGPMNDGYFDADIAVQNSVNAGCRTFVLDIDYINDCKGENIQYYPRLVVRDIQGKLIMNYKSDLPTCNSARHSNLKDVCDKINFYAFSEACQNRSDPVIIVLYFQRQPPGSYKSKPVLDYYSNVAKCLASFQDRFIENELDGGTFFRQKQEGRLLINKITDYNGKVLIFSNANTSGFRETQIYSPMDDLDFLVNLRLSYTQTKLGVTENDSGALFGILETAEDYMIIPSTRTDEVAENMKLKWSICLSQDPTKPVSADTFYTITNAFGINCVPISIFDNANSFMFTDNTFKTYSFIPKAERLRYEKPPVVTPAEPSPLTDHKQGKLRAPTVGGGY